MKTHFFTFVTAITIAVTGHTQLWQNVGSGVCSDGSSGYHSLVIDDGTPYVSFQDIAYSGNITVMKFDGTNWNALGNKGFANFPSLIKEHLAVENGNAYVVSQDNQLNAVVLNYDGANWNMVGGTPASPDSSYLPHIAIGNGTPYVLYDRNGFHHIRKYDGSNWVDVGNPIIDGGNWTSIAVEGDTPYIAHHAYVGGIPNIYVEKYDGSNWIDVGTSGLTPNSINSQFFDLAIDNGTPYVVYRDTDNADKTSVVKFDGTNWVSVGAFGILPDGTRQTIDVYNGTPYVSLRNDENSYMLAVMKYDGSAWVNVGVGNISQGATGHPSICVQSGVPYVAYSDGANDYKTTVIKFDYGVGLEESSNSHNIVLAPNPSHTMITIESSSLIEYITILDSRGREQLTTFNTSIDVSLLESGIYFAYVQTEQGIVIKRFVRE